MKIKIITDLDKEINKRKKMYDKIEKGQKIKSRGKIIYFTPKSFSKTFTPERIRLILVTKQKNIKSISHLARVLNRPFESVHRDVKYLQGWNLIKLQKHNKMLEPIAQKISFLI